MGLEENGTNVEFKDVPIIDAAFLEEKAIHPKIQIRVGSLDVLNRIAKFYKEIILRFQPDEKSGTYYYVILEDRYFIYREG